MHKLNPAIIQTIQNKIEFLLYSQATVNSQYRHVYANGLGSMYYCCGSEDIPTDPTAILIDDHFKVFCATEFGGPIKGIDREKIFGIDRRSMLQAINQKHETITPQPFFFDTVHLNIDGSFVLGCAQKDNTIEFSSKFQKKPLSSFNRPWVMSKLPNGMTVQFARNEPFIRTIEDGQRNEVLGDIKTIQRLSATNVVIWQKNRLFNDVYIIDFASTPEYYAAALNQAGQNELNQELVDAYKSRYMNVAELLLGRKNQK